MSKALFFIFWDEARTTYLHLVRNQNNSINSKQAAQKAATICGIVNDMSSIPLAWLTRTKSKRKLMALHNNIQWDKTTEGLPSRLVAGYCQVWNVWMKRVQGGVPPSALSGQLPSANKEKAFLYQHTEQRTHNTSTGCHEHVLSLAVCCCSPTPLQPVDPYSLGKAGSDSDFSVL